MEIRDFVRANRRGLRLLVVLPLIAGVVALVVLWGEPQQHRASVEVVVLPEGNEALSPNAIGQYVANFGEAVYSKPVKDAVVAATGVERDDLNDVETHQIGRSNVIEVSYVGPRLAQVKDVVVASARETILAVAEPKLAALAAARERHDAVAEEHAAATAAVTAFTTETGLLIPEEEYQSRATQLRIMQDNREESLGVGGTTVAAALAKVIAVRQAELDALGIEVQRFQELGRALTTSVEELRVAEAELRSAEAIAERASISLDLSDAEASELSRNERLVTGIAGAAGLTLVVGVALMVLLELFRTRGSTPSAPGAGWSDQPQLALAPAPPLPEPAGETTPTAVNGTFSGNGAGQPILDGELPGRDSDIGQHLADAFAALTGPGGEGQAADRPVPKAQGRR
jgi:hypothetical protein